MRGIARFHERAARALDEYGRPDDAEEARKAHEQMVIAIVEAEAKKARGEV